jgi:translation initiation factor eIF-2B subunit beta
MHPGTLMISLAAKQFSVPVIALSGVHKITPKYAFDQNTFNDLLSPL